VSRRCGGRERGQRGAAELGGKRGGVRGDEGEGG